MSQERKKSTEKKYSGSKTSRPNKKKSTEKKYSGSKTSRPNKKKSTEKKYSGSKTSKPNKKLFLSEDEEDILDLEIIPSNNKDKHVVNSEIWKPFPVDYFKKDYEVSNKGSIRNIETQNKLKLQIKNGYHYCNLSENKKFKSYRVHRLVAKLFVKNPDKENTIVNHIDGNKLNNDWKNLEWTTIKGNNQHAADNNLTGKTMRRISQFDLDGNLIKIHESTIAASKATNCSTGNIVDVCKGKLTRAKEFKFEYTDVNPNEQMIDPKKKGMKNIKSFPNYWISDDGKIYSTRGKKYLNPYAHPTGCLQIQLTKAKEGGGQIKKSVLMHVLVAIYFLKKPKGNYNCIRHKDNDKKNNKVENLEWIIVPGVSANLDI